MVARRRRKVKVKKVSRAKRVKRTKRRTRRVAVRKAARDDLQWRVSNSLLILVIGLLFLGYGSAQMGAESVIAYQVLPGGEEFCDLPEPPPSAWSECIDGVQKRVIYTCDTSTGRWVGNIETRECEEPFKELPVAYMLVGVVLIALAAVSLLLYKRKYKAVARPAEAPATW